MSTHFLRRMWRFQMAKGINIREVLESQPGPHHLCSDGSFHQVDDANTHMSFAVVYKSAEKHTISRFQALCRATRPRQEPRSLVYWPLFWSRMSYKGRTIRIFMGAMSIYVTLFILADEKQRNKSCEFLDPKIAPYLLFR